MKIWCQLPLPMPPQNKSYCELLQKDYNLVKRADTETVIKDAPTGLQNPALISYFGLRQINDQEILKSMLQAEKEGFDAVAGACYFDGAIQVAGNLMDIPVVGPAETSMYLARMMGNRFAVITTDRCSVPEIERHMEKLNMRSFAIEYRPVRHLTLGESTTQDCLGGDYGPAIENFKNIALGCIEDGAEVLIVGCGVVSPILTVNGVKDIDGVPIIDPMQVSLKFAEMLVDFKASGMPIMSHKGLFLKATKEDIQSSCKSVGLM